MILKTSISFLVKTTSSLILRKVHIKLLRAELSACVVTEANRVLSQIVNDFYFPMVRRRWRRFCQLCRRV